MFAPFYLPVLPVFGPGVLDGRRVRGSIGLSKDRSRSSAAIPHLSVFRSQQTSGWVRFLHPEMVLAMSQPWTNGISRNDVSTSALGYIGLLRKGAIPICVA